MSDGKSFTLRKFCSVYLGSSFFFSFTLLPGLFTNPSQLFPSFSSLFCPTSFYLSIVFLSRLLSYIETPYFITSTCLLSHPPIPLQSLPLIRTLSYSFQNISFFKTCSDSFLSFQLNSTASPGRINKQISIQPLLFTLHKYTFSFH